jgi:metal-sulfur cluster biosynthetic enzyme
MGKIEETERRDMNTDELLEELRKIKEPETGASILELGLIDRIDLQNETFLVYVNFGYMMPFCKACVPIHWMVVRSIVRKIERVLKERGIRYRIIESGRNEIYAEG